jgi:hypothetical protein
LPPAELALLSVFARRAQHGEAPLPAPAKELPDSDWKNRYLVELRWIAGPMKDLDETERALRKGMDGGYFSAHLSKLKKILRRELGPAAEAYLISDGGSRPRRYSLGLRPTAVRLTARSKTPLMSNGIWHKLPSGIARKTKMNATTSTARHPARMTT